MLSRIAWMLATWLLFCHLAQAEIHLTDVEGRRVTLTAPAQRAYIGFYYEDFLAVNGPESYQQVVAFSKSDWALRTSQWARYQAALPRLAQLVDVGSLYNQSFDFERLLTTRPDLLILAKWQLDGFANYPIGGGYQGRGQCAHRPVQPPQRERTTPAASFGSRAQPVSDGRR